MSAAMHIGDRVRRAVRLAVTLAVAAVLAAPLLGGSAYGAWLRVVSPEATHLCACGMKAGTCGCRTCELAEKKRAHDDAPKPYPVLRSQCDDDAEALPTGSVPPGTVAAATFVIAPSEPFFESPPARTSLFSRDRGAPAKPPPRHAQA